MTVSARLRELAGQATPGPWRASPPQKCGVRHDGRNGGRGTPVFGYTVYAGARHINLTSCGDEPDDADARLIALAPELALWASDAADALRDLGGPHEPPCFCGGDSGGGTEEQCDRLRALLARLASLVGKETA